MIEHNLRLVVYIARKFENTGIGIEDLVSIGTIGLIKAVNTFDPEKDQTSHLLHGALKMKFSCIYGVIIKPVLVSFDEPLNIDWDGNELLLSDVLGTENDSAYKHLEEEVDKNLC